jgi:hypothetical protein
MEVAILLIEHEPSSTKTAAVSRTFTAGKAETVIDAGAADSPETGVDMCFFMGLSYSFFFKNKTGKALSKLQLQRSLGCERLTVKEAPDPKRTSLHRNAGTGRKTGIPPVPASRKDYSLKVKPAPMKLPCTSAGLLWYSESHHTPSKVPA